MAQSLHLNSSGPSLGQRLMAIGQWLVDAAGTGLGLMSIESQPKPPMIGAQTFSGVITRHRRPPFRNRAL